MWEMTIKQGIDGMKFEFDDLIEAAKFVGEFDKASSWQGVTEYTITKKRGE